MKPESGRDFPEEWRWLYEEGRKHGIASCAQQIEKITADRDEWKQLAMSIPTKNADLQALAEALRMIIKGINWHSTNPLLRQARAALAKLK